MLRKLTLALVAAGALGTVALAPTSASAWWHGGWHRWGGPRIVVAPAYGFYGHGRGWCYWHPYRCRG
jgi:hypothetical protein